mgnify:CR=1 FL=1
MSRQLALDSFQLKLNWADRIKGIIAVAIAYLAIRLFKLNQITRIIRTAKHYCSREIDVEDANIAMEAVRQADFYFPGRLACMELSLAFVIFALTKRLSVMWCIGVKTDPFESHAWVEVGNKPFRENEIVERGFKKVWVV